MPLAYGCDGACWSWCESIPTSHSYSEQHAARQEPQCLSPSSDACSRPTLPSFIGAAAGGAALTDAEEVDVAQGPVLRSQPAVHVQSLPQGRGAMAPPRLDAGAATYLGEVEEYRYRTRRPCRRLDCRLSLGKLSRLPPLLVCGSRARHCDGSSDCHSSRSAAAAWELRPWPRRHAQAGGSAGKNALGKRGIGAGPDGSRGHPPSSSAARVWLPLAATAFHLAAA